MTSTLLAATAGQVVLTHDGRLDLPIIKATPVAAFLIDHDERTNDHPILLAGSSPRWLDRRYPYTVTESGNEASWAPKIRGLLEANLIWELRDAATHGARYGDNCSDWVVISRLRRSACEWVAESQEAVEAVECVEQALADLLAFSATGIWSNDGRIPGADSNPNRNDRSVTVGEQAAG